MIYSSNLYKFDTFEPMLLIHTSTPSTFGTICGEAISIELCMEEWLIKLMIDENYMLEFSFSEILL